MTDRDALVTKQIENALDFLPHTGDYIWHRLRPSAVDVIRTALRAAAEALAVPPQDRDISQSEHEDDLRDAKALELRYSYGELTDLRAYPLPSETRTHPSAAPTLPTETQAGRSPMTDRDVLVKKAREAVGKLRDAARTGTVLGFRERDPLVAVIHEALDLVPRAVPRCVTCGQSPDADIHYIGTVDSHEFVGAPGDRP